MPTPGPAFWPQQSSLPCPDPFPSGSCSTPGRWGRLWQSPPPPVQGPAMGCRSADRGATRCPVPSTVSWSQGWCAVMATSASQDSAADFPNSLGLASPRAMSTTHNAPASSLISQVAPCSGCPPLYRAPQSRARRGSRRREVENTTQASSNRSKLEAPTNPGRILPASG